MHVVFINRSIFHVDENAVITRRRATLTVMGQGILGVIIAQPALVDFKTILVNTVIEREIILFNPSECDVFYTLEISCKAGDNEYSLEHRIPNSLRESDLEIVQRQKVLPARSHQTVKVKACVRDQIKYRFSVHYRIDAHAIMEGENARFDIMLRNDEDVPRYHLCDVIAVGVHPVIKASDVRCEGFSKTILWQLFSLDKFNGLLTDIKLDPYAYAEQALDDDMFPIDGNNSNTENSEMDITFDFGATCVGIKPTVLNLTLSNSGVVSVDWVFHFPNDLEVEIEHWADPGDYTEEQLHHNLILDNNIFCITPKSGSLNPGESTNILMSYSHEFAGLHTLPVVFKLRNGSSRSGKEIMINFTGYSVPPAKKYLHLQAATYNLHPISILSSRPPIQSYWLMNSGSVDIEYYIDTSPLDRLKQENHNFEILKCLKTTGKISPGGIEYVEWSFHPLEEKQYEVCIGLSAVLV